MFEDIVDLIKGSKDFILTSHVNPDGDSIGSEIALYTYLKRNGKNARIINFSATPCNYTFLDGNGIIEKFDEIAHKVPIEKADVIFILDTNEYSRLRTMEPFIKASKAKKVCIDHHAGINGNGFDFYISDTSAPATGEILFKFFEKLGELPDELMSIALYMGIMTDTGSFRFPRTSAETHRITAKLIESGVKPFDVYSEVYNRCTKGRLKLLARFLNNVESAYDDKLVYSHLMKNDFTETETDELDTDGFSANLMSIATVNISVVILETIRGIKLSFRSIEGVNINTFAKEFGGGGHENASGAFLPGADFNTVKNEMILKAKKYITN